MASICCSPPESVPASWPPARGELREDPQDPLPALGDVAGVVPVHPCTQPQVVVDRQAGEDLPSLRHEGDAEGDPLGGGEVGDVLPGEDDRPGSGWSSPASVASVVVFPAPFRPEQDQPLRLEHLEGQVPQDGALRWCPVP